MFPDDFDEDEEAKSSADLRKFFIIIGYDVDDYSSGLNDVSLIDPNMYFDFSNFFREIKLISFKNGEPFREEDL